MVVAGGGAARRLHQRLPGGEDRHPELPGHAGHVLHAAGPEPGRHQAGHRQRRHQRRVQHRRLRARRRRCSPRRSTSAASRSGSRCCGGSCSSSSATWVLLRTHFGNWIFAVGGSAPSSRAVGVPVNQVKIGLFMAVGFLAWFTGMHILFAFNTVQSGIGVGNEFIYIVAAVVGGCLLTGGYGSVIGAAIGAFIFGMTQPGHRLRRLEPRLVLLLPRRAAARRDPAQQLGPQTSGGNAMTTTETRHAADDGGAAGPAHRRRQELRQHPGPAGHQPGGQRGRGDLRARRQRRRQVHPHQDHRGAAPAHRGHVRGRGRAMCSSTRRARPSTTASPPCTRTWPSCR